MRRRSKTTPRYSARVSHFDHNIPHLTALRELLEATSKTETLRWCRHLKSDWFYGNVISRRSDQGMPVESMPMFFAFMVHPPYTESMSTLVK